MDLSPESNQVRNKLGIPTTLNIADTESRQEKYGTVVDKNPYNGLAGTSKRTKPSDGEER